jgi:hypothetical protein
MVDWWLDLTAGEAIVDDGDVTRFPQTHERVS